MTIDFDDGAADRLVAVASEVDLQLVTGGFSRRSAAEQAMMEFSGSYADRFGDAASAEATDRLTLAAALGHLADAVRTVKAEAGRERERLADLAAWRGREQDRQRAAADQFLGGLGSAVAPFLDPQPSSVVIRPTPISASFSASDRPRTAGGSSAGTSSADPDRLRAFTASARSSDRGFADGAARLRNAWTVFRTNCGWADVSRSSLFAGFDRYLQENAADADWIDRIANAFERAGSGHALSDAIIDIAAAEEIPSQFQGLLAPGVDPSRAAALWAGLDLGTAEDNELAALPTDVLAVLGNLEGIPYWARHVANQQVLDDRIERGNLDPVEDRALRSIRASLGDGRFLISMTADVPPLAAISLGDLDTATNVTWAVPGMTSSSERMEGWVQAAQNIKDEQRIVAGGEDRAVIAWMGYDAPPAPPNLGVFNEEAAQAGAPKLAASIRGLDAARAGDMPRTNVLAHSYGTTTASLGLTQAGVHVDNFVSIASAGIPQSIPTADEIQASHVYAGQARDTLVGFPGFGDQYAYIGRDFSVPYRLDPTNASFGAETFGADGAVVDTPAGPQALRGVKDHGVWTEHHEGYLDVGTESLRNVALATTGNGDRVSPAR
ncbi:alpha/beta hydrolase [Curtobacterium sp. MCBD17_032]|uniref:alpha/beta hydrolase n=1 Tax=Curtobacterium sp. MCBD17_032 TaxID=2175659 RepID=UPI0015E8A918|nr:alpha/beta hydrolase [Curtobacterium sp. MCBD17_032]